MPEQSNREKQKLGSFGRSSRFSRDRTKDGIGSPVWQIENWKRVWKGVKWKERKTCHN